MIKKLFSILLIVFGSFLEIYYYTSRFEQDGISFWLSIIIGIALTLFLGLAVLQKNKPLTIALIIYSVLATSAGQSFSLSLFQKQENKIDIQEQYRQEEIEDIKYRITQIDNKYKQIQEGIEETAKTLHDRGRYRTALQKAEDQQTALNDERTDLNEKLSELRSVAVSHTEVKKEKTNIYEFYNALTFIPVKWLQFVFQTILSVFIALMAPLGITMIQRKKKKKTKNWKQLIDLWVRVSWVGKRTGKSNKIVPEKTFMKFTAAKGNTYTEKEYKTIKKAAEKTKCIDENETILVSETEAIKRIFQEIV